MSNRLIKLDSHLRIPTPSSTPYHFILEFNSPLEGEYCLTNALIPNSYYTITISNNQFYFNDGMQDFTVTLATGFYGINDLICALQNELNSVSSNFSVTYNSITAKITINRTSPFQIKFGSNGVNGTMGFDNGNTSFSTSHTASHIINLQPHAFYHISIDCHSHYVIENAISNSFNFVIPILGNSKEITFYEQIQCIQKISFQQPTKFIKVMVTDKYNNFIPLQQEWSLVLSKI
jgi:hypothetical protein